MKKIFVSIFILYFCFVACAIAEKKQELEFKTRSLVQSEPVCGNLQVVENRVELKTSKTAVIICDMWDQHWCKGATQRAIEMGPRVNQTANKLREQGVLIIHAPSGTMKFYKDTPQRKLVKSAPKVKMIMGTPQMFSEPNLPIDFSDEGCDCKEKCKVGRPWKREMPGIEIKDGDGIGDSNDIYYLLKQRGIENVIMMGEHANICILRRPFGIRNLKANGINVYFMRDLTDAMYNPEKKPYCSHFQGIDLVVQHIERYLCPTITSDPVIGGEPFKFKDDKDAMKKRLTPWGGVVDSDYDHAPAEAVDKWMDMKFGLRIHWGIYTLVDGHESWILRKNTTKNSFREKYQELYKTWNPSKFDANQWIDLMEMAGCKYFTFTTKHHEGFSMFDTKTRVVKRFRYDQGHQNQIEDCNLAYSIMETPFKRDVVKELTDAARKRGMGIGLYFSHPDWYDADFRIDQWNRHEDAKYTKESDPAGWQRMVQRHRQQLKEILTNYGPIDMVSLDMYMRSDFWPDMVETIKMARKIQPDTLFRNRGIDDYGDYTTPERTLGQSGTVRPWKVIYPCGSAFSYRSQDYKDGKVDYKPKAWIITSLIDSASKGGNFQVAFGPKPDGSWPEETVEWLKYTGDWLKVNGEAIYKTRAWKYDSDGENVRFTRSKDSKYVYAIALNWPGEKLHLTKVTPQKGSKITMLGYKKNLKWQQDGDGVTIELPKDLQKQENRLCEVAWAFKITNNE